MNRKTLCGALAALMIAGTGSYALAQTSTTSAAPASATTSAMAHGMHHANKWHGKHDMHRHGMRGHHMRGHSSGPSGAVIADLAKLQRIYAMQGKSSEMTPLYQHVLASTKDQKVRNYVYARMARAQMRPADTSAAVATLRKSLDENLTALNKRQEQHMQRMQMMKKAQN